MSSTKGIRVNEKHWFFAKFYFARMPKMPVLDKDIEPLLPFPKEVRRELRKIKFIGPLTPHDYREMANYYHSEQYYPENGSRLIEKPRKKRKKSLMQKSIEVL